MNISKKIFILSLILTVSFNVGCDNSPVSKGNRYLSKKSYDKAIVQYQKALEVDSKDPKAYLGLSEVYSGKGDIAEAMDMIRKGLEENPEDEDLQKAQLRIFGTLSEMMEQFSY